MKKLRYLALIQGMFYVVLGLWPIFHLPSFLFISGDKIDTWLVKTVGLLIAVIGFVLVSAATHRRLNIEIFLLGVLSACSLGMIDVVYVWVGRISPVYLGDALFEFIFVILWQIYGLKEKNLSIGHRRA